MKFKIDPNLPIEAADLLTTAGHDAVTVYRQSWVVPGMNVSSSLIACGFAAGSDCRTTMRGPR